MNALELTAINPQATQTVHLVKLCRRLEEALNTPELLAVADALGLDGRAFGLEKPALRLPAIIAFVDYCQKAQRLEALLAVCYRLRPGMVVDLGGES